jgi:hypothetical protein
MNETVSRALRRAGWRKSSYSQGQNDCVEVSYGVAGWVGIRDSKLGAGGPILAVPLAQWRALLAAVHAGELD